MKEGVLDDEIIGPLSEETFLHEIHGGKIGPKMRVMCPSLTKKNWCQLQQLPGYMKAWQEGEAHRERCKQEEAEEKRRQRDAKTQEKAEQRRLQREARAQEEAEQERLQAEAQAAAAAAAARAALSVPFAGQPSAPQDVVPAGASQHAIATPTSQALAVPTVEAAFTPAVCPTCQKDDCISRVSAVVSSGQASGRFSGPSGGLVYAGGQVGVAGGFTTLFGGTVTQLAAKLAPPNVPPSPSGFGELLVVGLMCLAVVIAPLIVASSVRDSMTRGPEGWQGSWSPEPTPAAKRASVIAGITTFVVVLVGVFFGSKQVWKGHTDAVNRWEAQRARHQTAVAVWHKLYYCSRDHVVFEPIAKTKIHADLLQAYFQTWIMQG